jgi:Meiotically up-regulated gene 113
MSELTPDEPSIAAAGANPGRRKAVAQEARGAWTFAVTSARVATPIPVGAGESQFCASGAFSLRNPSFKSSFRRRIHKLQTDSPCPLELLHIEPGSPKQEKLFHRRFAAIRANGEWFHKTPELLEFVEQRKRIWWGAT